MTVKERGGRNDRAFIGDYAAFDEEMRQTCARQTSPVIIRLE